METGELRTLAQPTPMGMIAMAVERGADLDQIQKLMDLQERILNREAEQAWSAAMSACQADMGRISADAENPQTRSRYASYANLDRALRPVYSQNGFSLSFGTEDLEGDRILVYVDVSHCQGHTKRFTVPMPCDGKGAKGGDVMTKTHATGAAMSYGMRYLLKMVFNVAVGEDDKDGNAIPTGPIVAHLEAIKVAPDLATLQEESNKAWKIFTGKADRALLLAAKDARKAILTQEPK